MKLETTPGHSLRVKLLPTAQSRVQRRSVKAGLSAQAPSPSTRCGEEWGEDHSRLVKPEPTEQNPSPLAGRAGWGGSGSNLQKPITTKGLRRRH